jgi:hypothetical protein
LIEAEIFYIMTETYSRYAHICAKFYELTLDAKGVAEFVMANSGMVTGDRALFVGGMFEVAAMRWLQSEGDACHSVMC